MRIISTIKDIYDHLQDYDDNRLVYERKNPEITTNYKTKSDNPFYENSYFIKLYIGGFLLPIVIRECECLITEDQFKEAGILNRTKNTGEVIVSYNGSNKYYSSKTFLPGLSKDIDHINERYNSPVVLLQQNGIFVSDFLLFNLPGITKFISIEDIYNLIRSWMSQQFNIRESENIAKNTNENKIINNGFDDKSFKNTNNRLK